MHTNAPIHHLAAARALAFVVAGNGFVDAHELDVLERHRAFGALGVDRDGFAALVRQRVAEIDGSLSEHAWIPAGIETAFDDVLDAVGDDTQRLLVCRLAEAVVTAEPQPGHDQRLLIDHMRARWHVCREQPDCGTPPP